MCGGGIPATLGSSRWGFLTHIIYEFQVDYNVQVGLLPTRLISPAASLRFYFVSVLSGSVLLPAPVTH